MFDFGMNLKKLREKKGYSLSQLSRKLDVGKSSLSKYENNLAVPSIDTLVQLALIYGVSVDYLVGLEKSETIKIDGLKSNQIDILQALLKEFKSNI